MADFSLTTLFVVPVGQTALPSSGSTQNLTAGQLGFFKNDYTIANAGNIAAAPYFYVAQGRANSYLQGSKRSDKIKGGSNITEFYKVEGCPTAVTQISEIRDFKVKGGDVVTLTLRAHSSYIETLYFNGLTRSVTVNAPCLACDGDPCANVNVPELIDNLIGKLQAQAPGINSDNVSFNTFYTFQRIGNDANAVLRISAKPLTVYGVACDIAAFPYEYDRMYFRAFISKGPATTADFIVEDNCDIAAKSVVVQRANYPKGRSAEIADLEQNFYSYQAGYLKHLYRMAGYNQNFESYVSAGSTYDTFYVKFNEYDKSAYQWGDYIQLDSTVIIAVVKENSGISVEIESVLVAALGPVLDENGACITTTSTTTAIPSTTTTTTAALRP